ncbi:MAG: FkbM family methyltransferase [Gemmobacter sp.]
MTDLSLVPDGAQVVEAVIDGVTVRFCVADAGDKIQRKHAQGKFWERDELAVMAAHFPKGGVLADVGANVGNHTLFAALFMGASRVIAFEPNPPAIALLRANVALNGLGTCVDLSHLGWGLAEAEGAGYSTVTRRANLGATRLVADGQGAIAVRTGDAMLAGARVDFIKLDVEGMEMAALRGLSGTIALHRPPVFLELDHANRPGLDDWLTGANYVIAHEGPRYPANQDLLVLPKEKMNA